MTRQSALRAYREKRGFTITTEPSGDAEPDNGERTFVIQKHSAQRLHYEFRLELDGALKCWAVSKGPSLDPSDKRLAVEVEDHPLAYAYFEGTIPAKQYGAGKVEIWDTGTWTPVGDAKRAYRTGHLKFELHGERLRGQWALVRLNGKAARIKRWLLIKHRDAAARPSSEFDVTGEERPERPAAKRPRARKPAEAAKRARNTAVRAHGIGPVDGAVRSPLPPRFAPELATLVAEPPADPHNWSYEIKFDGYRILTRVSGASVQLVTRNGHDWSTKLPSLLHAIKGLALPPGWYDGEMVALNDRGISDFAALQGSLGSDKPSETVLYLFDLPYSNGFDLRAVPLTERRRLLSDILARTFSPLVRFSGEFIEDQRDVVASACKLGLEGLIAKRRDSHYVSRRSNDWVKLKCGQRQEFVVGGYTQPRGSRAVLGALLLGVYDDEGRFHYAGNVGSGFGAESLRAVHEQLAPLVISRRPFHDSVSIAGKPQWVRPRLVVEVSFSDWTRDGRLRHPVFHGVRTDKDPASIRRERPAAVE